MRRLLGIATFGLILLSSAIAQSQTYPARPVTLIVGFPAGTSVDIVARVLGQKLSDLWGQPVVVENRPGAGGNVAAGAVARAPADGYTLFLANNSVAISATLYRKLSYDALKDFKGVTMVSSLPFVLVVTPSLPANSIKELIALAKAKPHELNFGSGGVGNADHLSGELFKFMAGVDMVHVPYQGGNEAMTDTMSGYVSMYFSGVAAALPLVQSGKLKALGTSGPKRSPAMPNVPTIAESGLPNYEVLLWNGLLAPAGVPQAIVDKVSADAEKALKMPDLQARFASLGLEISPTSPAKFDAFVKSEVDKWGKVIDAIGLKVD